MRIAVVGAGISGLAAAYLLSQRHEVTLYEAQGRLGGHSSTEDVETDEGTVAVDMGFIVYNQRNYPLLTGLFGHLGVEVAKSNMSFGVSAENGRVEYCGSSLSGLFAQRRNIISPSFLKMMLDIARFNRHAKRISDLDAKVTMADYIKELGLGDWFMRHYLLAMGGAIWDTAPSRMLEFPARTFIRFFDSHGLLSVSDQPQWYTVRGGSRAYVDKLEQRIKGEVRKGQPVAKVARGLDGVMVGLEDGTGESYDQVVIACHSDQALRLVDKATDEERKVLSGVRYHPNEVVLHSDTSFMPKSRRAWASWVYLAENKGEGGPQISLSYWMNSLQPLDTKTQLMVTLNPAKKPAEGSVRKTRRFAHPALDRAAIEAQEMLGRVQGRDRIWYCGAWVRHGFHEDGLQSAVDVARALGCDKPW